MNIAMELELAGHHLQVEAEYEEGDEAEGLPPCFSVTGVQIRLASNVYIDITDLYTELLGDTEGDDVISHLAWQVYTNGGVDDSSNEDETAAS
jgi:hypothetical protein